MRNNKLLVTTALISSVLVQSAYSGTTNDLAVYWNDHHISSSKNNLLSKIESKDLEYATRKASHNDSIEVNSIHDIAPRNALVYQDDQGKLRIGDSLKKMQNELIDWNDLSYALIQGKGQASSIMADLHNKGYRFKFLNGLEGTRNNLEDLSGVVGYNAETGKIIVALHGTVEKEGQEGWGTNMDCAKLRTVHLQAEYAIDLMKEISEYLTIHKSQVKNDKDYKRLKGLANRHFDEFDSNKNSSYIYDNVKFLKDYFVKLIDEGRIAPDLSKKILNAFTTKLRVMKDIQDLGFKLPGQIHSGFLKKHGAYRGDLIRALREIFGDMTEEQKKKAQIYVTGHSMGGGLGQVATFDLVRNFGKEFFGSEYDNAKRGQIQAYLLSQARGLDEAACKAFDKKAGKHNIIRHNVIGDPVPIVSGDKYMQEILGKVPILGKLIGNRVAGYGDSGFLLAQDADETWQQLRKDYSKENSELAKHAAKSEELTDALAYVYSWMGNREDLPAGIAGKQSKISLWRNPFTYIRTAWNAKKLAGLIWGAMKGDKKAGKKLSNRLATRYGHLHLMYNRPEEGLSFDKKAIDKRLDRLVQAGERHELERKARLKAAKKLARQQFKA